MFQAIRVALSLCLIAALPAAAATGGEVFTTNEFGHTPVGNQYLLNTDVYMAGGPEVGTACQGTGLAYGAYYFQVTNPSGSLLLTTDSIEERRVFVAGGVIAKYDAATRTLLDGGPCGTRLLQLMPFAPTPLPGNEYKLWLMPIEHYNPASPSFFGFDVRHSKMATFKVQLGKTVPQTVFSGSKFYDQDEDGVWNPGANPLEVPIAGWRVEIFKGGVFQDATFTDANGAYQFIRDQDGSLYTIREVAPGGFIGDNVPGAIWLAKTPRTFIVEASAAAVVVPAFGNISFEVVVGAGRTKGFWHNLNGSALLEASDPDWRDTLTTNNGTPLCLRRNISTYDPGASIFAPLASPATFSQAHSDFKRWIVGTSATGHAGYILSTQVAAAALNRRHGFMQFNAYIDRFQNGILVSFDDMLAGVQENLLCHPGAGMTGPQDPEQALRTLMLGCINEFGSINNSGDPNSPQPVFGPRTSPALFTTPYSGN